MQSHNQQQIPQIQDNEKSLQSLKPHQEIQLKEQGIESYHEENNIDKKEKSTSPLSFSRNEESGNKERPSTYTNPSSPRQMETEKQQQNLQQEISVSNQSPATPSTGGNGDDVFKMYTCKYCGKKFDRAFSCNRHERIHTGYKPCFCCVCGRGFSEPRNLRHHVIRFHSDGALRHLIKRDRRKKKDSTLQTLEEQSEIQLEQSIDNNNIKPDNLDITENKSLDYLSSNNVLKDANSSNTSVPVNGITTINTSNSNVRWSMNNSENEHKNSLNRNAKIKPEENVYLENNAEKSLDELDSYNRGISEKTTNSFTTASETYSNNLSKIITTSLENNILQTDKRTKNNQHNTLNTSSNQQNSINASNNLQKQINTNDLEPGEIRLDEKSKILDRDKDQKIMPVNEETQTRLNVRTPTPEDNSNGILDHSPQFSSYAPRLNIIQQPVERNKALIPITDDIGRSFYECPYCHKLFGSSSDMNRHLDFHEDLRPYTCDYCDYSARTNSQLKVHKMRHEG